MSPKFQPPPDTDEEFEALRYDRELEKWERARRRNRLPKRPIRSP